MMRNTKYVGLDISERSIAVAVAEQGQETVHFWGTIPNDTDAVWKLIRQLGKESELEICYGAGPEGVKLYQQLAGMGISILMVTPPRDTMFPKKARSGADSSDLYARVYAECARLIRGRKFPDKPLERSRRSAATV
jgi:hypothetical protein